ncbi:MAG: hypothetical protein A3F84_00720 [Candidatus Handelsmanbacteria bacterium RIFCSPLOWO2_12_FULL_64_10]|uniref:Uncharacterized protein n=1 Tax=Handelsmanbacteria sp. (strain RIFCSPLOWO2_12_FULL_64_10) TaxID=1817868 RepID=A0A1F6D3F7_HANXR|nr:MAG: hypothetical protein A3F84_00720 [Candidatus Handelsmanbacteria bacterium RIFCSPLOWO2_12_FULL_64_10]
MPAFGPIRRASFFLPALLLILSSPPHAPDTGQIEKRIFDLVNAERARRHSQNMARHRFFSHTDPEGKDTPARKLTHFPGLFSSPGENVLVRGKARSETACRTDDRQRAWPNCEHVFKI